MPAEVIEKGVKTEDIQKMQSDKRGYSKKKKKEEREKDSAYWYEYAENKFTESKNWRSTKVEKQWMINWAYYRGYQNLKYNRATQRVAWDESDPLQFYVNMVYATVRAVRNAVTRNQPQWDVDALPYGSVSFDEARLLGSYLGSIYEKLGIKRVIKEVVLYGLLYGIGVIQYGFDAEQQNGVGELWVEALDPFDVYIDPIATSIGDASYITKVVQKRVEEIEGNEVYFNTEGLQGDGKRSESSYKDQVMSKESGYQNASTGNTVLLHETWCKTKEGVRIITTVPSAKRVIRNELTDWDRLPFVLWFPDINSNEIYGEGWVKHLVPLNRALNHLERSVLEYNILFAKGKYKTDRGSGVKIITNENGQIIRTKRGFAFEQMDMKPLPSTPFNQISNLKGYMQDVGAAHEAFMGRAPSGVTAGIAFETLVANSYVNLSDLIDNMVDTMEELGRELLRLGYKYFDTRVPFRIKGADGKSSVVSLIGGETELSEEERKLGAVVPIPRNPLVTVRIVSGVAYTKVGKQDRLLELRRQGDVDRQTLLEAFNMDSEEVTQRLEEEKMAEAQTMGQIEGMMRPDASEQGQPQAPSTEEAVAAFAQQVLEAGYTFGPEFEQDPSLIQMLMEGALQYQVDSDKVIRAVGEVPMGEDMGQAMGQEMGEDGQPVMV